MAREAAMDAIKNLGDLEETVRPMIRNATILSEQRKQTYEVLNRLREIAQEFLATYEGNRNNLDGLYRVIKSEAEVSSQKQRDFLQKVAEVLEQALTDPTEDAVKGLIAQVETLMGQMREKNSQPSYTRAQVNQQISPNNVGTLIPGVKGPMPPQMPPPDSDSKPDGNVRREVRRIDGLTNPSGFKIQGGKRRSIKRGGFVWDKTPGSKRKSMTRRTRSRTRTRRS
jgi:hypothetical protein